VRVLKSKWFDRFARKECISNATLLKAIARAEAGLIDADIGGGVIKQRVARPGESSSGGYRVIVYFRRGNLAVFMYGFAKSDRGNIDRAEEREFREAAKVVLGLTGNQLDDLVAKGDFIEVEAR
jgi:hypothetical protein